MPGDINFIEVEESLRKDPRLSANSIKYKSISAYIERKKWQEAIQQRISEVEKEMTTLNEEDSNYEEKVMEKSTVLARLEAMLTVEPGEEIPTNFVNSRAIKLKEEWLKNGIINTKGSSTFKVKENDNAFSDVSEVPIADVDVVEVSQNKDISENVDLSINSTEKEINEKEIKNFYDNAFAEKEMNNSVEPKKEVEVKSTEIDRDELEEEVNRKVQELFGNIEEAKNLVNGEDELTEKDYNVENNYTNQEYVPMTDEEVAQSREKIENDKYQELNTINITNGQSNLEDREEIVVAPEREEVEEYTILKQNSVENVETNEPKSVVISTEEKENLEENFEKNFEGLSIEELTEMLSAKRKVKEEKEAEANTIKNEMAEGMKINAEIAAEEKEAEKTEAKTVEEEKNAENKRIELQEEEERQALALRKMVIGNINALDNDISILNSNIANDKEELASVNKDTEARRENITNIKKNIENRRENITNIAKDNERLQESIAKSIEMKIMFGNNESIVEDDQKTL